MQPATGVKILTETDLSLPDAALHYQRTYRSALFASPAQGPGGWTSEWQSNLQFQESDFPSMPRVVARRGDGEAVFFAPNYTTRTWKTAIGNDVLQPTYDASGAISSWLYTTAMTGAVETYDAKGKLLSVREQTGRTTTLTYDTNTQLTQVTAPSGRSLTLAYDAQGRVSSVTAPDGAVTKYAYNATGMLTSVTWPDNTVRQYVYEDTRFPTALTGVIDEAGVRYATYAYDNQGRAITSELTAGADRYQFQYQANGQTIVTQPSGTTSTYTFLKQNGVLLPTGVSAPCPTCGNTAQSTSYDANNNPTSKTGYDGSTTTYVYDALGRETQRVVGAGTADAKTTTTEWDPQQGSVSRMATPNKIEAFSYDANGNLLSHTVTPTGDANGSQGFAAAASGDSERTAWTYDANGQVLTATDSKGLITVGTWTFTYDGKGDLLTLTNPSGQTGRVTQYDAAGRVLEAVDTEGLIHKLSYNARGWLTDRQIGNLRIHYDYDPIGQRIAVTGPEDTSARYVYDAAHRLIEIFDNLTIQQPANLSTLASPFSVERTQHGDAEASSVVTRVKSVLVSSWNATLSWLKRVVSELIRSAHAQVGVGSGTGIGYRPPMPVPTGSQSINVSPRPEEELDSNVGSRRMPPEMGMLRILMRVQRACSAAISAVTQAFNRGEPPGDCDWDEYIRRNKAVTEACKRGQSYCKPGDDVATLLAKRSALQSCGNARRDLMNRCFRGGDSRHQGEWVKIIQQVEVCNGL
ncbi:DUF6531 domain-containing protein [Ralstonia sp. 24A2]|uniref:DUF6531 domain-containing protein n=1 Tax=Ralstonia sp. 24A2 TaxID=3447364 RepID=UPI003F695513